jgi:CHAD domain-containing protein
VAALSTLQDELGWLNDAAVADRLVKQLQDGQIDLDAGAGFLRGYLASRVKNADKKIGKLWKKFAPMKLPC